MAKIDANSGVQAQTGFDFQRNTCIYVFLENYDHLKNQNYFIMLEHYDDIVFGFLTSIEELSEIRTYQAKKSSTVWTTNGLLEIIQKMCNCGIEVSQDNLKKSPTYVQSQYFVSNNTITLDYKCSTTKKKKKIYINETNELVTYSMLDLDCQKHLNAGNSKIKFDNEQLKQFSNLNFRYIDMGRTTKSQLDQLTGKFKTVFGSTIIDPVAARDTFIYHLREIENTFNQNGIIKLSDVHKRIESSKINQIFKVLTTKNLALEFCRKKCDEICEELGINVFDKMSFELDFENSLDKFKDLQQGEHQKIIQFVERNKTIFSNFTDDVLCVKELFRLFEIVHNSTLSQLQLKSAISAGYFLILMQK
jgi:hypothetical protein